MSRNTVILLGPGLVEELVASLTDEQMAELGAYADQAKDSDMVEWMARASEWLLAHCPQARRESRFAGERTQA